MACCLRKESPNIFPAGFLGVGEREGRAPARGARVTRIVEKPGKGNEPSNLVNIVVHYHKKTKELLKNMETTKSSNDDVYELSIERMIKDGFRLKVVIYTGVWKAIKYSWNMLDITKYFLGG